MADDSCLNISFFFFYRPCSPRDKVLDKDSRKGYVPQWDQVAEPGEYDRTPQGPALDPAGESGSSWVRGTGLQPRAPSTKQELTAVRSGAGDSGQLRSRATPGVHDCTGHGTDLCPAGAWGSGPPQERFCWASWQYLETSLVVTTRGRQCDWHLVGI